jgi:hypothetical protein
MRRYRFDLDWENTNGRSSVRSVSGWSSWLTAVRIRSRSQTESN